MFKKKFFFQSGFAILPVVILAALAIGTAITTYVAVKGGFNGLKSRAAGTIALGEACDPSKASECNDYPYAQCVSNDNGTNFYCMANYCYGPIASDIERGYTNPCASTQGTDYQGYYRSIDDCNKSNRMTNSASPKVECKTQISSAHPTCGRAECGFSTTSSNTQPNNTSSGNNQSSLGGTCNVDTDCLTGFKCNTLLHVCAKDDQASMGQFVGYHLQGCMPDLEFCTKTSGVCVPKTQAACVNSSQDLSGITPPATTGSDPVVLAGQGADACAATNQDGPVLHGLNPDPKTNTTNSYCPDYLKFSWSAADPSTNVNTYAIIISPHDKTYSNIFELCADPDVNGDKTACSNSLTDTFYQEYKMTPGKSYDWVVLPVLDVSGNKCVGGIHGFQQEYAQTSQPVKIINPDTDYQPVNLQVQNIKWDGSPSTISWGLPSAADSGRVNNYQLRIEDDDTQGSHADGATPEGKCGTDAKLKDQQGDECVDNVQGTNYTFKFEKGHHYHIWVDAVLNNTTKGCKVGGAKAPDQVDPIFGYYRSLASTILDCSEAGCTGVVSTGSQGSQQGQSGDKQSATVWICSEPNAGAGKKCSSFNSSYSNSPSGDYQCSLDAHVSSTYANRCYFDFTGTSSSSKDSQKACEADCFPGSSSDQSIKPYFCQKDTNGKKSCVQVQNSYKAGQLVKYPTSSGEYKGCGIDVRGQQGLAQGDISYGVCYQDQTSCAAQCK